MLRLLWFTLDENVLKIDGKLFTFDSNEILCFTQFHTLEYVAVQSVNLLRFNRQFYCAVDHDSEVGCKRILYYGAARIPRIKAAGMQLEILDSAWKMAVLEFENKDDLQQEMLQMMLKRI